MLSALERYRPYLERWTFEGQSWLPDERRPLSRYHTFRRAFESAAALDAPTVIELGT